MHPWRPEWWGRFHGNNEAFRICFKNIFYGLILLVPKIENRMICQIEEETFSQKIRGRVFKLAHLPIHEYS